VILLPGINLDEATMIVERLCQACEARALLHHHPAGKFTVSVRRRLGSAGRIRARNAVSANGCSAVPGQESRRKPSRIGAAAVQLALFVAKNRSVTEALGEIVRAAAPTLIAMKPHQACR
jgi:hypothetical protein